MPAVTKPALTVVLPVAVNCEPLIIVGAEKVIFGATPYPSPALLITIVL